MTDFPHRIMLKAVPVTLGVLLSVGCSSPLRPAMDALAQAEREADTPVQHAFPSSGREDVVFDDEALEVASAGVEVLVAIALQQNPGLRAAERRVKRLAARGPQAAALDDPMLSLTPFGEMAETAAGQVGWMAGVSQRLPYPGKLSAKEAMANREAAAAVWALAEQRLEVAASVRRAYWSRRYAARAADVVRRDRELLEKFRAVAEAKYRAGSAEQQDVLRAGVELAGLDQHLLMLDQQHTSATAMLNQLLDRPMDAALPIDDGDVALDPAMLDRELDAWLADAVTHPKLAALTEMLEKYRQQRRLAKLDRYPDLTFSLNYSAVDDDGLAMSANGDDQWSLGFGINLPIWQDKRDAAEREALAGVYETAAIRADAKNQLAYRVRDAFARVVAQRASLVLFEQQILPEAEQAVEAAELSYRAGRGDFLVLIDNWRRLTGLRLMFERTATQLQQDLADLRLAAGQPVATTHDDKHATDSDRERAQP